MQKLSKEATVNLAKLASILMVTGCIPFFYLLSGGDAVATAASIGGVLEGLGAITCGLMCRCAKQEGKLAQTINEYIDEITGVDNPEIKKIVAEEIAKCVPTSVIHLAKNKNLIIHFKDCTNNCASQ